MKKLPELLYREALIDFMRTVARNLGCLPSYADPRPNGGNSHIIAAIEKLKAQLQEARTLLVNATPNQKLIPLESQQVEWAQRFGKWYAETQTQ